MNELLDDRVKAEEARIRAMSPEDRIAAHQAAKDNPCTCWWGGAWGRDTNEPPILCKRCQYTDPDYIAGCFGYE